MRGALKLASAWAFPGWAGRTGNASFAKAAVKIFATMHSLPATRAMAVMRNLLSQTSGFVFQFPPDIPMPKPLHYSAPV